MPLSRAVPCLLGNPFARPAAELRREVDALASLGRAELERLLTTSPRPEHALLAVIHAKALAGTPFDRLVADASLTRGARRLPKPVSALARTAVASARCVERLTQMQGQSRALWSVRQATWAACFGRTLPHAVALERLVRDHDVIVTGETGTGKEAVARAVAEGLPGDAQGRPAPFAEINAAAVPDTLIESELFGHEKGAFTGATSSRKGLVRSAHGGALFLDEVGDLPLSAQVKLLRVIETDQVQAVGSDTIVRVDVRFVAATHHDLEHRVREGRFREDLYQRLAGVVIRIPPLRDRPEDITAIGEHFVRATLEGLETELDPAPILRWLHSREARQHPWPGNVRELKNVLRNLLLGLPAGISGARAPQVDASDVPVAIREGHAPLAVVEAWYVERAVQRTNGNLAQAARLLGIDRSTLARKVKSRA